MLFGMRDFREVTTRFVISYDCKWYPDGTFEQLAGLVPA